LEREVLSALRALENQGKLKPNFFI
jgi:hypothetical protein